MAAGYLSPQFTLIPVDPSVKGSGDPIWSGARVKRLPRFK